MVKTWLQSTALVMFVCVPGNDCLGAKNESTGGKTGFTLIGTPLREPDWTRTTKARLEKDLEIAQAVMSIAPEREDSFIWLGRRLGYLVRYQEAIDVFSDGLELFPDSYKLLRFRVKSRP